jgi:hypothetical protein
MRAVPTANLVTKVQENEYEDWIETDKGVYVMEITTHDTNH